MEWIQAILSELSQLHPVMLWAMIAILPLVGMPLSVLLLAGSAAYGWEIALVVGLFAMPVNNLLGFAIARYGFRRRVQAWLSRRSYPVPDLRREDFWKVIFLFRLTPGIPLMVQNYALGLSSMPVGPFLFWSFWAQLLPLLGFVLTGGALFSGHYLLLILGVCLLLLLTLVGRQTRKRSPVPLRSERT